MRLEIQFSISIDFLHTQLNFKTVLYKTIQFSISTVSMLKTLLFPAVQFNISTLFNYLEHFNFKLFSLLKQFQFKQFSPAQVQILFPHS